MMSSINSAVSLVHDDQSRVEAAEACFNISKIFQQQSTHPDICVQLCRYSIEFELKLSNPDAGVVAMRQRLLAAALLEIEKFQEALDCLSGSEVHFKASCRYLLRSHSCTPYSTRPTRLLRFSS